jgi:hypothetical protein
MLCGACHAGSGLTQASSLDDGNQQLPEPVTKEAAAGGADDTAGGSQQDTMPRPGQATPPPPDHLMGPADAMVVVED